ncbi:IS30 family transposase [Arthrobacter sp. FW306-04-A]|uniref:IS30 family transposase n=1 Tax=Arthrobacter sp. FW306-04-A TaxID=2879619 RepID=UPI0037BFC926|nr:IS30 family transposase [Arthrobacter sp. FW306-04-A]
MTDPVARFSERLVTEKMVHFWDLRDMGMTAEAIAVELGWKTTAVFSVLNEHGGVRPSWARPGKGRSLSFAEREEIMLYRAQRLPVREIARRLGRAASTISRELRRGVLGRNSYRAAAAHRMAFNRARRPKQAKLMEPGPLRDRVKADLAKWLSPEQISGRLRQEHQDDPGMQVSHESIYQGVYRARPGKLVRERQKGTRTGRAVRKPRRSRNHRTGRIQNMTPLIDRTSEAKDRLIAGHWEGDLITGKGGKSAIGTLVERATGTIVLLRIGSHKPRAHIVRDELIRVFTVMPGHLTRSLTWDQGVEMHRHQETTAATRMPIYFCEPRSPWQRGSNENANKLLRQYFPKGTSLAGYTQAHLDTVAAALNDRPRKRYDYATPNERLETLTVAMTT